MNINDAVKITLVLLREKQNISQRLLQQGCHTRHSSRDVDASGREIFQKKLKDLRWSYLFSIKKHSFERVFRHKNTKRARRTP